MDQANPQNGRAADSRRDLAQRIAASRTFARSARLPQFLLYVCDRALTGRTDEITEQQIGVQVFGRPSDYSSGEDNIVRVHARRLLRKKLEINRQFDTPSGFQSDHDPGFAASISRTRSTNMPDMEFLWRLSRTPTLDLSRTTLRYARELRIGDLKDANAILIGARRANPGRNSSSPTSTSRPFTTPPTPATTSSTAPPPPKNSPLTSNTTATASAGPTPSSPSSPA